MSATAEFALVFAIRFEPRDADQIARGEMRQTGEVERAHREAEFTALEQFTRKLRPTVLRLLISADIFIGEIRNGFDGFARGGRFRGSSAIAHKADDE